MVQSDGIPEPPEGKVVVASFIKVPPDGIYSNQFFKQSVAEISVARHFT